MEPKLEEMDKEIAEEVLKKNVSDISEEILGRYFTIQGKTAIVHLNFDTFAELVDSSLGDDSVEKLNDTLFDKLKEVFALLPRKYKIKVDVYIKEYGDYTIQEAEKIVKDNFILMIYTFALERRKKNIAGLGMLFGGIGLLLLSYFLDKQALPQLLFDVINISGTLLVWEAADLTLIEKNEEAKQVKQYLRKFQGIRLLKA